MPGGVGYSWFEVELTSDHVPLEGSPETRVQLGAVVEAPRSGAVYDITETGADVIIPSIKGVIVDPVLLGAVIEEAGRITSAAVNAGETGAEKQSGSTTGARVIIRKTGIRLVD